MLSIKILKLFTNFRLTCHSLSCMGSSQAFRSTWFFWDTFCHYCRGETFGYTKTLCWICQWMEEKIGGGYITDCQKFWNFCIWNEQHMEFCFINASLWLPCGLWLQDMRCSRADQSEEAIKKYCRSARIFSSSRSCGQPAHCTGQTRLTSRVQGISVIRSRKPFTAKQWLRSSCMVCICRNTSCAHGKLGMMGCQGSEGGCCRRVWQKSSRMWRQG